MVGLLVSDEQLSFKLQIQLAWLLTVGWVCVHSVNIFKKLRLKRQVALFIVKKDTPKDKPNGANTFLNLFLYHIVNI